jgi:hypothetical protein
MDALLMAQQAAERFETIDNPQRAGEQRITAIMYALIALAEATQAQTPATIMVGRDIIARWSADRRYATFIAEERADAMLGENAV